MIWAAVQNDEKPSLGVGELTTFGPTNAIAEDAGVTLLTMPQGLGPAG